MKMMTMIFIAKMKMGTATMELRRRSSRCAFEKWLTSSTIFINFLFAFDNQPSDLGPSKHHPIDRRIPRLE